LKAFEYQPHCWEVDRLELQPRLPSSISQSLHKQQQQSRHKHRIHQQAAYSRQQLEPADALLFLGKACAWWCLMAGACWHEPVPPVAALCDVLRAINHIRVCFLACCRLCCSKVHAHSVVAKLHRISPLQQYDNRHLSHLSRLTGTAAADRHIHI
jgi:hypothetical protein